MTTQCPICMYRFDSAADYQRHIPCPEQGDERGDSTMKFPVELQHTFHKFGGQITCIRSIGHTTAKPEDGRSRDVWYFHGAVRWNDGTASEDIEIAPYSVCCKEGERDEVDMLMEALSEYLLQHGTWCRDPETKHEGWYATERPVKHTLRARKTK